MPVTFWFIGLLGIFSVGVPIFVAFFLFNTLQAWSLFGVSGPSLFASSIVDTVTSSALLTVPLFILMGEILFRSGSIKILFDAVDHLVGQIKGRQYAIVVSASIFLGALSGSAIAVSALLGRTLLPVALDRGGDPKLVTGLVLGGACLAPIIPPSILVVLIGMLSGTSISQLLLAGIVPGILAGALFLVYVQVRIRLSPDRTDTLDRAEPLTWTSVSQAILSLIPFSLVIFLVLGLILLGIATPTEAASSGVVGAVLVAVIYRQFSLSMLWKSLKGTATITSMVLLLMASSKILTQLMAFSGVTTAVLNFFLAFEVSPDVLFLILMIVPFFLCMFLDQVALMILLIPIYKPIVDSLGFDPIVFWTVFLLNLTVGAITPPFGYAIFSLKAAAPPQLSLGLVYRSTLPFVAIILFVLVTVWFFPTLATFLPELAH